MSNGVGSEIYRAMNCRKGEILLAELEEPLKNVAADTATEHTGDQINPQDIDTSYKADGRNLQAHYKVRNTSLNFDVYCRRGTSELTIPGNPSEYERNIQERLEDIDRLEANEIFGWTLTTT